MLFPYEYVPHTMDKMQKFIDFIFLEVWCKASTHGSYKLELFGANEELYDVMEYCHFNDSKYADFFASHVEQIYGLFSQLDPTTLSQLQTWYRNNNNIERVCSNDPATSIAKYSCLCNLLSNSDLYKKLSRFFKELYNNKLLTLKIFKDTIGTIDDHYKVFRDQNKITKCPFCGINNMKGTHHRYRDAYDHYLPKGIYPFNSINFHNLVPTCHECNSSYKTQKDPCHNSLGRRKVFYPYNTQSYNIELTINLKNRDWQNIQPEDIDLIFGPAILNEEIAAWKEIYGIEERYKAKCCAEEDGKDWLVQLHDEWQSKGGNIKTFMDNLIINTQRSPYTDNRFLKKPFLEACIRSGLFEITK